MSIHLNHFDIQSSSNPIMCMLIGSALQLESKQMTIFYVLAHSAIINGLTSDSNCNFLHYNFFHITDHTKISPIPIPAQMWFSFAGEERQGQARKAEGTGEQKKAAKEEGREGRREGMNGRRKGKRQGKMMVPHISHLSSAVYGATWGIAS